jgi:hypothetical protein
MLVAATLMLASDARGQEAQTAPYGAPKPSVAKWNAKTLLLAARAALEKGDLDRAEALAVQAEKIPRGLLGLIQSNWTDTPAKVRCDIQAARARETVVLFERFEEKDKIEAAVAPKDTATGVPSARNERETWPIFRAGDSANIKAQESRGPVTTDAVRTKASAGWKPAPREANVAAVSTTTRSGPAPKNIAVLQDSFFGIDNIGADTVKRIPSAAAPQAAPETKLPSPIVPVSAMEKSDRAVSVNRESVGREPGSEAHVDFLKESAKAFATGNMTAARQLALRAKQLRPSSTWEKDNLAAILSYLRRPPPKERTAPQEASLPENLPPVRLAPTIVDVEADAHAQPAISAREEECEPSTPPMQRTVPAISRVWFVLVGMGLSLVLMALFRLAVRPLPDAGPPK